MMMTFNLVVEKLARVGVGRGTGDGTQRKLNYLHTARVLNTYGNTVWIFSSDFVTFSTTLLERMFFFVLELHISVVGGGLVSSRFKISTCYSFFFHLFGSLLWGCSVCVSGSPCDD